MGLVTTDYGTFATHEGTLAQVAGAVVGIPATKLSWTYDSTGKCVCIEKR